MSKKFLLLLAGLVILVASASAQMRSGEAAIFFRSGDVIIDRVVDISSTRLVLQTANSGEFQLREVWMINYVNDSWDFPGERDQIETNEHYVFLKNGDVISGRITDFSSERFLYQLQTGDEIAPGRIRRIYFSKRVPVGLQDQGGEGAGGGAVDIVPGTYRAVSNNRNVELRLDDGGVARLMFNDGGQRRTMNGNWSLKTRRRGHRHRQRRLRPPSARDDLRPRRSAADRDRLRQGPVSAPSACVANSYSTIISSAMSQAFPPAPLWPGGHRPMDFAVTRM